MIPKIIHQIWIQGYNNIPSKLQKYHNYCKNINSDFKYLVWDEEKIKKLLTEKFDKKYLDLYEYYKIPAQKADFARYIILYSYGGIYLDMDTMCKKNLSVFINNKFFFTATKDLLNILYKRYQTGIIGAIPNHPLFQFLFKNMFERISNANNLTYSTGTKLFYDSVHQYINSTNDNDINIIDPKYLHPCGIFDDEMCGYTCDDCYIVHTNYSSWSVFLRFIKYVVKNTVFILIILVLIIFIIIYYSKSKRL
jgi:mannosyltransferase OCH1-like enzyme